MDSGSQFCNQCLKCQKSLGLSWSDHGQVMGGKVQEVGARDAITFKYEESKRILCV